MPTLHVIWIFASITFGSSLLASGQNLNVTTLNATAQAVYDTLCQSTAKSNGIQDTKNWVWSDEKEYCVPDALDSTGPWVFNCHQDHRNSRWSLFQSTLTQRSEESTEAPQGRCMEGGMDKCLDSCTQFKPTGYKSGDAGAWAGCRMSCGFRCSPPRGGCWKGYCWAGCNTGFPLTIGVEWCYTSTKSYSQSYSYVTCTADTQCNFNWKCAGPCAAF